MSLVHVSARVTKTGDIELLEPLPQELLSTTVELVIYEPDSLRRMDPWQVLGLLSFFEDDDDADAIYDSA